METFWAVNRRKLDANKHRGASPLMIELDDIQFLDSPGFSRSVGRLLRSIPFPLRCDIPDVDWKQHWRSDVAFFFNGPVALHSDLRFYCITSLRPSRDRLPHTASVLSVRFLQAGTTLDALEHFPAAAYRVYYTCPFSTENHGIFGLLFWTRDKWIGILHDCH